MHYLRQDPESTLYDLHTGGLRIGLSALARLDILEEAAQIAQALVDATGRTALLSIWSESGPTIIRSFPGTPPIYTTLTIGSRLSLTHSATGKVFLAFQKETYISDFLKKTQKNWLSKGRSALNAIRKEVRKSFIARTDGTIIPGLRALAVPVFDLQGQLALVIAAIASDGFPANDDLEVEKKLMKAAEEMTNRIGGRVP